MKLADHFERKGRNNDPSDVFITLKDDAPDWLKAAVRDAHNGTLPSDWVFEECFSACYAIDCGELQTSDTTHEYVDGRVDIYTKTVYGWAADFCLTDLYSHAEEEAKEMGLPEETEKRIQLIQFFAVQYIVTVIVQAWEANRDENA